MLRYLIAAIRLAIFVPLEASGWTSSGPPLVYAAEVAGVATDPANPNVVYASDENGFFRSDDAGGHWSQLTSTALTSALTVDPSDPMNLYSAPSSDFPIGILRSTDGGSTWEPAAEGFCGPVLGIVVARSSPSVLYAVASDFPRTPEDCGGVFRSDDFGVDWSTVSDWSSEWIAVDPIAPNTAYVGVVAFELPGSSSYFIGRTIDGGASWEELPFIPFGSAFAIDPTSPAHLFAFGTLPNVVTLTGAFYESNDRGNSWEMLSNTDGSIFTSLVVDPASPNVLFASSTGKAFYQGGGVFKSQDRGHTWAAFGLENEPVVSLAIDGQGKFLHASVVGKGVFDTTIGRPQITPVPVGGSVPRVRRLPGTP